MAYAFWALLLIGLSLDLLSLHLELGYNKRGYGPSGVPVVSWLLYFLAVLMIPWSLGARMLFLALLTIFHVACHYLIPEAHKRWLA
jgi:hypothetical protein